MKKSTIGIILLSSILLSNTASACMMIFGADMEKCGVPCAAAIASDQPEVCLVSPNPNSK